LQRSKSPQLATVSRTAAAGLSIDLDGPSREMDRWNRLVPVLVP